MAEKQPLNATFFAFQKRDGSVLLPASVAFAVLMIVGLVVLGVVAYFALGGPAFVEWYNNAMIASAKGGAPEPPPNLGAIFLIFPIEMIALFFYFVALAAFESSSLRWLIRGEKSNPFNLCFGADMWRVYGTYWFWFLFFFCTAIIFAIWMVVLGAIGGAIGGKDNAGPAVLIGLVGCLVWFVAWIYVAVRLAPAAATSIGAGHFAPLKAWGVSSGRFWALFGAFLLIFIIYIIASIVVGGVTMGAYFATVFGGVDWSKMGSDPTGFSAAYQSAVLEGMQKLWSSPASIALYIGGQIAIYALALLIYVMCYGVNARAVRVALDEGKLEHNPAAAS